MTTDQAVERRAAQDNLPGELLAALEQIERLSGFADRKLVDVPTMLGDIARAAIAKARSQQ